MGDEYLHSGVSSRLRAEVVESELLFQSDLSYMVAVAALYGNNSADVEKGSAQVNSMVLDAQSHIPYLTGGMSGRDMQHAQRMAAVEEYRKMRDEMRKKDGPDNRQPGTVDTPARRQLRRARAAAKTGTFG